MSSADDLKLNYQSHYKNKEIRKLYPTEFVVRSFLGSYSSLKPLSKENLINKKVLDLGCGDGRNMPFLRDLGLEVFGVEINKDIVELCQAHMNLNKIDVEVKIGKNSSIPYPDQFFDFIVACHACYYLEKNDDFLTNIREISRVLKPKSRFVFSVPKSTSYLLDGADIDPTGHAIIRKDPLRIRNGTKIKYFETENQIEYTMKDYFSDFIIGSCENNWWGTKEFCWTVICLSR